MNVKINTSAVALIKTATTSNRISLSVRSTMENVLYMETRENGTLYVLTRDGDTATELYVPAVIEEEGNATVSADMLKKVLPFLGGDTIIKNVGKLLRFEKGEPVGHIDIPLLDVEAIRPTVPSMGSIVVPRKELEFALQNVLPFCSKELGVVDSMHNVSLAVNNGLLTTEAYMNAVTAKCTTKYTTVEGVSPRQSASLMIPSSTVQKVIAICTAGGGESVKMSWDASVISFQTPVATITGGRMRCKPIDLSTLYKTSETGTTKVVIPSAELQNSMRMMNSLATEGEKMQVTADETLSFVCDGLYHTDIRLPATVTGERVKFLCFPKYANMVFSGISGDATIYITNTVSPVIIRAKTENTCFERLLFKCVDVKKRGE